MQKYFSHSKLSLLSILILLIVFRLIYFKNNEVNGYNATNWDSFGYYMYLPGIFIYNDVKELKWVDEIDEKYNVLGNGEMYQARLLPSGTYFNKYLSGVAIIQTPFFFSGHLVAKIVNAPQDGFSWPYQYAILFGALFWVFLGFVILRKVLLYYFSEKTTTWTLLFIAFCSNLLQYTSIDSAQSHAFIFPLYAIVLWLTIRWHKTPKWSTALGIGAVIGLATISRPTELIMLFIPLLWSTQSKENRIKKWQLVRNNLSNVLFCFIGGLIAISPQLIYWKYTTGDWIFNVGSKWYFLNPWWRVLIGVEKGWFIYTPIAILFILGFFFMKGKDFKRSAITFCLLNIWIIISWSDWKYGASYSTRALVQSYPIFALSLACFVERFLLKKRWIPIMILGGLSFLNFYQLYLYNNHITENFSPLIFW